MSLEAVHILSVASCNSQTRTGFYEASLSAQGNSVYYKADLADTTPNRCVIQGLIDGVKKLNKPSEITFIISTNIGRLNKPSGPNKDLLVKLNTLIVDGGHSALCDIQDGRQGKVLREKIRAAKGFDHLLLPGPSRLAYEESLSVSKRLDNHKNKSPNIYVIPPIDFGWEHLPTVEETLRKIKKSEEVREEGQELYDLAYRSEKFTQDWERALSIAKSMGMNSELRHAPSVMWMPAELHMEYGFVFKEDNNGTTYVVSHQEIPWLQSISMTQDILNSRPGGIQGTFKQVRWAGDIVEKTISSFERAQEEIPELARVCTRLTEVLKLQRESGWIIANRDRLRLELKRKATGLIGISARSWSGNPLAVMLRSDEQQEMTEYLF